MLKIIADIVKSNQLTLNTNKLAYPEKEGKHAHSLVHLFRVQVHVAE